MNGKEKFQAAYPGAIFLEHQVSRALQHYLIRQGWIAKEEQLLAMEKPGEGNMNIVARVVTDQKTFILKQALPWVQKYPQIAAPVERMEVEAKFYELIRQDAVLQRLMPQLLGSDPENFILALEDLGKGADYTYLYQPQQQLPTEELQALVRFISHLHKIRREPGKTDFPDNQSMKLLNHEHIFHFPFLEENGLDLDTIQEGLQPVALEYKRHARLKKKIETLGALYLETGPALLQGDYYPGSWLKVPSGIRVIDPEFGHFGQPEFEVGVMLAHCKMARLGEVTLQEVLTLYEAASSFDEDLMWAFAGVEILRRIIGIAQLPLSLSLADKEALLEEAAGFILHNT